MTPSNRRNAATVDIPETNLHFVGDTIKLHVLTVINQEQFLVIWGLFTQDCLCTSAEYLKKNHLLMGRYAVSL